jgi:hypothetical protein
MARATLTALAIKQPTSNTSEAGLNDLDVLDIARRAVQLYAETHPRPPHVTQLQAAEMLGISRWTVSKMVRAGQLKLNRCGMIPIEQVDRVLQPV